MMKKLIILFIAISALVEARADNVPLVTGEWAPYTSKSLEGKGFITEIVTEVCREMGVVPEYQFHSWEKCFSMTEEGYAIGAFPYTYTDARAAKVYFSDTVFQGHSRYFQYGEGKSLKLGSLNDIRKVRIGGIKGYFYEEALKRMKLDIDYSPDEKSAITNLVDGKVDMLILNEIVGWHIIKKDFSKEAKNFKTVGDRFKSQNLKLIVSKNFKGSEKFLNKFNRALKKVLAGEKYKSIIKKYSFSGE